MSRRISQTEARHLRRRVKQLERVLEAQRGNWNSDWPEGAWVASVKPVDVAVREAVRVSRLLGHAVVVTESSGELRFFALPLAPAVKP